MSLGSVYVYSRVLFSVPLDHILKLGQKAFMMIVRCHNGRGRRWYQFAISTCVISTSAERFAFAKHGTTIIHYHRRRRRRRHQKQSVLAADAGSHSARG